MICSGCGHDSSVEIKYNCTCQCHDDYHWFLPLPQDVVKDNKLTLEEIKKFCLQYDMREPNYPSVCDDNLLGMEIYYWFKYKLDGYLSKYDYDHWNKEMENV